MEKNVQQQNTPDEHVFKFFQVYALNTGVVLSLVTEMSVGQTQPGQLPVCCET